MFLTLVEEDMDMKPRFESREVYKLFREGGDQMKVVSAKLANFE